MPDTHKRLIRRAHTLLGDDEFGRILAQERGSWTRVFWRHPLGVLGPYPEWALLSDDDYLTPTPVADEIQARASEDWRTIDTRVARKEWQSRVDAIALAWWPPALYPAPGRRPPARRFVAACLRWGGAYLDPKDWFVQADTTPGPISVYFDASDLAAPDAGNPEAVYWEALFQNTLQALHRTLDAGEAVTEATIRLAMEAADQVAEEHRAASMHPSREHLVLPLHHDIDTNAWRTTIWEHVQSKLDARGHPLHRYVQQLKDSGKSDQDIADLIGVDRNTVANWTRGAKKRAATTKAKGSRPRGRT